MPTIVIEIEVDSVVSEGATSIFVAANREIADNTFGGRNLKVSASWKDPKDPRILPGATT